jgi:hypothetical protein
MPNELRIGAAQGLRAEIEKGLSVSLPPEQVKKVYECTLELYRIVPEHQKGRYAREALRLLETYHYLSHPGTLEFFGLYFWAGTRG